MSRLMTPPRLFGGVLLVSLAVNAFFVGAAATDLVRSTWAGSTGPGGAAFRYDLRWLDGRLPDDAMAKVADAVEKGAPGADVRFEHLRDLREGLGELVAEPAPNIAAIDTKLSEIRTELDRLLAETQAATVASMLALPAATRANLGAPDPQG